MPFEIPAEETPVKKDDIGRLPLTPLSSRKLSHNSHVDSVYSNKGNYVDESNQEIKDVRRKLLETERALKRSAMENEKLKDQVRDKIRQKQDEATEKKRLRDEMHVSDRRHNHEMISQLREEKSRNAGLSMEMQNIESERDFLRKKVEQSTREHASLIQTNEELSKKLQYTINQQKIHGTANHIQSLELEGNLKRHLEELHQAQSKIEVLERRIADSQVHAQRSDAVQKSLVDELTEARMDHAKINDLTSRLQKCTQLLNEKTSESSDLRERFGNLSAESVEQKKLISSLRSEIDEKSALMNEISEQKKSVEKSLEEERKELSNLHGEISQILHDGAEKDEKLLENARSIALVKEEREIYEAENSMLRAQMKSSEAEVEKSKKMQRDAEKRLDTLQNELQQSYSSVENLENQMSRLQGDSNAHESKVATLEIKLRDSRNEVALLGTRLDDRNTTIEQQRMSLDEARNELAEYRARQSVAFKNLEEEKNEKMEIDLRLKNLQDQLSIKKDVIDKGETRIMFLEGELQKERLTNTEQVAVLADITARIDTLINHLSEKDLQIADLNEENNKMHEEVMVKSAEILNIENERAKNRMRNEELQKQIDALCNQIQSVENVNAKIEQALRNSEQEVYQLTHQLAESRNNQTLIENERNESLLSYDEELSRLKVNIEEARSNYEQYKEKVKNLQKEKEALVQDSRKHENRVALLEKEVQSLEHVSDELEAIKEKHFDEISALQSTVDQLENRQLDSARQLHRLMKDLREANAETMDVIRWRDEERAAHDELKKDHSFLQKASSEDVLRLKHELSEVRSNAENATQQLQTCIRENSSLEKDLRIKEEEIRVQQVSLSTCQQELACERNEQIDQKEKLHRSGSELGEIKQLLNLNNSEIASLRERNHELSERVRNADETAFNSEGRCEKLRSRLSNVEQDLVDAVYKKDTLVKDYEILRKKYNSLKEHEKTLREQLKNANTTIERLEADIQKEKSASRHQKLHYEQHLHEMEHGHSNDKREIIKLTENVKSLKSRRNDDHRTILDLESRKKSLELEYTEKMAKAQEERDLFIQKYHAACYRNVEVERECHTARQNYLNEYESFEQLKVNQETVLNKVRERIVEREAKFRAAIDHEKRRADNAELKIKETRK